MSIFEATISSTLISRKIPSEWQKNSEISTLCMHPSLFGADSGKCAVIFSRHPKTSIDLTKKNPVCLKTIFLSLKLIKCGTFWPLRIENKIDIQGRFLFDAL